MKTSWFCSKDRNQDLHPSTSMPLEEDRWIPNKINIFPHRYLCNCFSPYRNLCITCHTIFYFLVHSLYGQMFHFVGKCWIKYVGCTDPQIWVIINHLFTNNAHKNKLYIILNARYKWFIYLYLVRPVHPSGGLVLVQWRRCTTMPLPNVSLFSSSVPFCPFPYPFSLPSYHKIKIVGFWDLIFWDGRRVIFLIHFFKMEDFYVDLSLIGYSTIFLVFCIHFAVFLQILGGMLQPRHESLALIFIFLRHEAMRISGVFDIHLSLLRLVKGL